MHERLIVNLDHPHHADDGRFDRFRLIPWWDQKKLSAARVLVVGAGALGNEIIKNLALLGVGHVVIADLDNIENSNLSRSILYRDTDSGAAKATIAAAAAKEIYPDICVSAFVGDIIHDLGAGAFRWADVVIGGLDNREARLAINRHCWRVNRPWIDGAIEQIQGTARVFAPDGPCYECTMSEADWRLVQMRRSCNLLTRQQMEAGRTPTTPTISSIIAGVQCQEAVKLLHGLPVITGRGWVFDGISTEAYTVEFQRKPGCFAHETLAEIVPLEHSAATMTAAGILAEARSRLGDAAQIDLGRDVVEKLICPQCGASEVLFSSLSRVAAEKAVCPACGASPRDVATFDKIRGNESFLQRTLAEIGVPRFDILTARAGESAIGLELSADSAEVLGPAAGEAGLEWT